MEKYKLEIKKSAAKEIQRLPDREKISILTRVDSLRHNPRPQDCKKLSAQEIYRVRCGNYRILYHIKDDVLVVYVVKVGHRKDVYKG